MKLVIFKFSFEAVIESVFFFLLLLTNVLHMGDILRYVDKVMMNIKVILEYIYAIHHQKFMVVFGTCIESLTTIIYLFLCENICTFPALSPRLFGQIICSNVFKTSFYNRS